jgi:hypothetical protein
MIGLAFIAQIVLLVLWFTVLTTLSAWLVFIPLMFIGVIMTLYMVAIVDAAFGPGAFSR